MAHINTKVESERGCGYRKPGGIYLIGGSFSQGCGKLPIELTSCPCCGQGIKFRRGFSWISYELIEAAPCVNNERECLGCDPFNANYRGQQMGLLFVGEKFYETPDVFMREASAMGISKRISTIPKGLKVGETWVMLAHNKAVTKFEKDENGNPVEVKKPGIFACFIPKRIEYVVTGEETADELEALEKRGLSLVKVIPNTENQLSISE